MIRHNDEQYWLYAAVGPKTSNLLYTKLDPTIKKIIAHTVFTEFQEKHDVDDAVVLIDGSLRLNDACARPTSISDTKNVEIGTATNVYLVR